MTINPLVVVALALSAQGAVLTAGVPSAYSAAGADSTVLLAQAATASPASAAEASDLGPTSAPPWNPPGAISRRRGWERAVLLPQRVLSLPFSALGAAMDAGLLRVEETALPQRVGYVTNVTRERAGITLGIPQIGDRVGTSVKLGLSTPFLGGSFKNVVRLSHSVSTRHYHVTEVGILGRPLGIDYFYEWRPEELYYGIGMGTAEEGRSSYANQFERVRLRYSFGWNRDEVHPEPRSQFDAWFGPRMAVTRTGREEGLPSVETLFPDDVDLTLDRTVEHLVYGFRFLSDWREGRPHWWEGWRVLTEVERYDESPNLVTIKSAQAPGAQFTRTTVELEGAHSFGRDPRTFRLMGRIIDLGITASPERMMLGDFSILGARRGLRGFETGRFRDRDLVLARLTYVFPLVRRFEMDVHIETGTVSHDVWRAPRFDRLEQSVGFALRGRSSSQPHGAFGMDISREGVRFRYSLGNPDR